MHTIVLRLKIVIIITIFFVGCTHLHYGIKYGYDLSKIKNVAVVGIKDYPDYPGSGEIVTGGVILGLINRSYSVIERTKLQILLEEHKLALTGVLNEDLIQQIGNIVNADVIVTGTIVEYSPKKYVTIPLEISERGGEQVTSFYDSAKGTVVPIVVKQSAKEYKTVNVKTIEASFGLNLRMLDVKTGSVIWSGTYNYNSLDITHAISRVIEKLLDTLSRK